MAIFEKEEVKGLSVLMVMLLILGLLAVLYGKFQGEQITQQLNRRGNIAADTLSYFNPNTFEYEELRQAGVPADVAVNMIRWRHYGKVYRMKEDLALVGGMTDSLYMLLSPYAVIDDSLRIVPMYRDYERSVSSQRRDFRTDTIPLSTFRVDTAGVEYLSHIGFSKRQAEVFVQYRDMIGGIYNEEQLRKCYVVSDSMAVRLLPHIIFSEPELSEIEKSGLLELNSADTAALIKIYGIGERSAADIIRYRDLLGGYYSVEQLSDIKTVTESNFEKILPQICCDSCKISKIDINFASPKEFEKHPYISSRALRRIVKQRQLKGGWSRIEEMIEQEILTKDEAERLAPYLRFRHDATSE